MINLTGVKRAITNIGLTYAFSNAFESAIKDMTDCTKGALDTVNPKVTKVRVGLFKYEYRNRRGKLCDKNGKRIKGGK